VCKLVIIVLECELLSPSAPCPLQNGGYAVYNFDTKEPGLGVPDVLLTVKSSPASVAMYCNPAWVTVEDENNKIAGPLNAIFQSGAHGSASLLKTCVHNVHACLSVLTACSKKFDASAGSTCTTCVPSSPGLLLWPWYYLAETGGNIGNIYLSATNPIARPPSARIEGTPAYDNYTPAYNCTVRLAGAVAQHSALGPRLVTAKHASTDSARTARRQVFPSMTYRVSRLQVINYDTDLPAHYTLSATFNFHDVKLNDQEQAAIRIIWNE
jgi:hypothetical protein